MTGHSDSRSAKTTYRANVQNTIINYNNLNNPGLVITSGDRWQQIYQTRPKTSARNSFLYPHPFSQYMLCITVKISFPPLIIVGRNAGLISSTSVPTSRLTSLPITMLPISPMLSKGSPCLVVLKYQTLEYTLARVKLATHHSCLILTSWNPWHLGATLWMIVCQSIWCILHVPHYSQSIPPLPLS